MSESYFGLMSWLFHQKQAKIMAIISGGESPELGKSPPRTLHLKKNVLAERKYIFKYIVMAFVIGSILTACLKFALCEYN